MTLSWTRTCAAAWMVGLVACAQPPPSITLEIRPAEGVEVAAVALAIQVFRPNEAVPLYTDTVVVSSEEQPEINVGTFDGPSVLQFFVFACAADPCAASSADWHGCVVATYDPNGEATSAVVTVTALNDIAGQPQSCRTKLGELGRAAVGADQ